MSSQGNESTAPSSTDIPSPQLAFVDGETTEKSLSDSQPPLLSPDTGNSILSKSETHNPVPGSVDFQIDPVTDSIPKSEEFVLVPESQDSIPVSESQDSVPVSKSQDSVPVSESQDFVPVSESQDSVPVTKSHNSTLASESPVSENSHNSIPVTKSEYTTASTDSLEKSTSMTETNGPKPPPSDPETSTTPTNSISITTVPHSLTGTSFTGINYLGSSTVDAPVSETEANRKMEILRTQSAQAIPIILTIPEDNSGSIVLKDPSSDQVLVAFFIRHVLFCARGQVDSDLQDCIAINVLHKRSGFYHCHIFRCDFPETCQKVFEAIGKAFKKKKESLSQMTYDLDVIIDLQEDDGKGNYSPVSLDKDCFKIRPNTKKKLSIMISQSNMTASTLLNFEKCFGILLGVGHDVARNKLHLLDNAQTSSSTTHQGSSQFSISGFWDTTLPFLSALNEEQPKTVKHHILTVATDVIATNVTEPIRILREIKVRSTKMNELSAFFSNLAKRKLPVETFSLSLERIGTSKQYKVKSLKSTRDNPVMATSSPVLREKPELGKVAGMDDSPMLTKISKQKLPVETEDSDGGGDEQEEDDLIVSGWGDEEQDLSDDLLKQWHYMLDKWDGRDRWEPKGEKSRSRQLVKLVRKGIPGPLRCQLWQMLSGADNDPQLIEAYRILFTKDSPTENVIKWDIKRTYVGHEFFQEDSNREALYKISKAYSVYDTEVGYCQGFSFMAAVLLLQKIPEEQAFAILVKIMFNYGHRDVFKANFKELHLMFYQLEKLLEEYLHELYEHFMENSVETHMYASQWFLTIFTAKFPLHVTYHIIDMYLCEGASIVFQIAMSLLKLSQRDLMALDFEGILNYFRANLPKKYSSEDDARVLFETAGHYSKINQRKLKKLEKDYQTYLEQQALLEDPHIRMERENKQLRETVLRLQRENDDLAEELVSSKVALRGEMDKLEERIDVLSKEGRAHKSSVDASNLLISELREELQQAKQTYQNAMMQLTEERQQHAVAITEYKLLFQQLDEGHQKQKEELNQELLEVKAQLGTTSESLDSNHKSKFLTSEQRLRQVELELAQTKLALVEAQCKNQELEHKVTELTNELTQYKGKPSWRSRFS